jgi:hypothetical protein
MNDKTARVALVEYTGRPDPWRAADLMIFTKRTRVEMAPGGVDEIAAWPEEKKLAELTYMANTVPSSWEFTDYVFLVTGVTRAFTHQLVRTRSASYAQQAMQVLDVSQGDGWSYHTGPTILADPKLVAIYDGTMSGIAENYRTLVRSGALIEDAREVLPTGILTNICVKMNLRSLCDLLRKRASPRNVSEWDHVLRGIREAVLAAHPWSPIFLDRTADRVAADLYRELEEIGGLRDPKRVRMTKLVDQLLTRPE